MNEYPGYHIKQFDAEAPVITGDLGNTESPFIVIAPGVQSGLE